MSNEYTIKIDVIRDRINMILGEVQPSNPRIIRGEEIVNARHIARMLSELGMYINFETNEHGMPIDKYGRVLPPRMPPPPQIDTAGIDWDAY